MAMSLNFPQRFSVGGDLMVHQIIFQLVLKQVRSHFHLVQIVLCSTSDRSPAAVLRNITA